jgi:UDP-3-O-[3-hydroxymyristoyl] glucosamine N-acyltransferase
MFCVAGSTRIGNRVIARGQTGISDHVTICEDVVLVHRAGVPKDISKPGAHCGGPVQPLNEYMRNTATFRHLDELRKCITKLQVSNQPG